MENGNQDVKKINPEDAFHLFKSVSIVERYNFYEYLAVLIDGGVSISEAIKSTAGKTKNMYIREKIQELTMFISSGDSISRGMKKLPQIFQSSEVAIIEAGESTGTVTNSLFRLSEELKKIYALKLKIKTALTYPIIIFLFLLVAVVIVLMYVIPAIKPMFDTSEVELPMATQALVASSDFLGSNFLLLFVFVFGIFVFVTGYKNTEKGRASIDNKMLRIPLVGVIYRNYILSNIAANIGSLIGSGVNVIKALSLAGKATNNSVYEALFQGIMERVSKGEKITDAMKEIDPNHFFFPNDFVQMLAVGEKTATLDRVAKKINDQYTREVDYSLANMTRWIEPLAILIASVFVLWFAFAIFGAILKVTQTIG